MAGTPVLTIIGNPTPHPPVVFLHAYPLHSFMWKYQVHALEKKRQLILVDLPGFGQAEGLPEKTGRPLIEDVAALVLDAARATGHQQFTWVGCSMGGYIIMEILRRAPEAVAHMILCDTRADADSDETREKRKAQMEKTAAEGTEWLGKFLHANFVSSELLATNPELARELAEEAVSTRPDTIPYYLEMLAGRPDSRPTLEKCTVPTLLLCGEEDSITPLALHEEMHQLLTNSTLLAIPKAGHLSPAENPPVVNQAILDFLNKQKV